MRNKIIVIDDDADHLLICKLVLEKDGYQVMGLPGCREDEELQIAIASFKPDLVFMDHNMPGKCGMDLTRMLKSDDRFRHIPVIYFTSEDNIADLAAAAGADGHFRKPFDIEALLDVGRRFVA